MSDNRTHILSRPQLRATDNGKASLKVGEKIPYVSGSLNSAVATPGAIPYATTQFQQIDIGTNIDLQPHVNGTDDVSMHIKVEVSNEPSQVSIAGISEPVIGQQIDEADIRMKDGEVSILGGLSDKEYQKNLSGFPGLTNIPLLGYLFGEHDTSITDTEVLIAIIPHILRTPDMSAMGEEGVLAGTERVIHVERKSDGTFVSVPPSGVPPATVPVTPPTPLTPAARPQGGSRPAGTQPSSPTTFPGPPAGGASNSQPNNK